MGRTRRHHHPPLFRLQWRWVLPHLYFVRNRPNLRIRPRNPQDQKVQIRRWPFAINLHLLHSHLCHQIHPLLFLQGVFLSKTGIFTVWLNWRLYIQISINLGNGPRWIRFVLHCWPIQDQLQSWFGRHKVVVLNNRGSRIRIALPFKP